MAPTKIPIRRLCLHVSRIGTILSFNTLNRTITFWLSRPATLPRFDSRNPTSSTVSSLKHYLYTTPLGRQAVMSRPSQPQQNPKKNKLHSNPKDDPKDVKIDLHWVSNLPLFDYDTDMDVMTTAQAFAQEPWTRQYFQQLREHHQTHYEQMGHLQGYVTLDGESHNIYLPAFRDHSYGKLRDWRLMHRYVFHHIFLENGCKGVVGVVCQPSTCSRLVLGNWWCNSGKGAAVTWVDLDLKQHGERGTPPKDYAFTFIAGGEQHVVEVEVVASPQHYLGWDWEARMVETWVKYRVDGVSGAGICEWNYRHCEGRPEELNTQDPEWAAKYRPKYLAA